MEIFDGIIHGYFLITLISGFFSGSIVGLFGAGGGIVTVPILVYALGFSQYNATRYSMIFIGANAAVSAINAQKMKQIKWNSVFTLGIISFVSVFLFRTYLVPSIPKSFTIFSQTIAKDTLAMIFFSLLLFTAAYLMTKRKEVDTTEEVQNSPFRTISFGVFLGAIIGLFGVGGGFLTTPYFVAFDKQNVKTAIGTSTALLLINSIVGIIGDLITSLNVDLLFVLIFLLGSFGGVWAGIIVKNRVSNSKLSLFFIYLVSTIGIGVLAKEVYSLCLNH
ncbi:MAG: sulfite exporter TauE/SafE family protein [Candidatus Kapabacteria bacterium]|nr:sulfite exporter TauE/SafE family protein [Candidatus Kapabacteria bacterium]